MFHSRWGSRTGDDGRFRVTGSMPFEAEAIKKGYSFE